MLRAMDGDMKIQANQVLVGDCVEPKGIMEAIQEGFDAGFNIH